MKCIIVERTFDPPLAQAELDEVAKKMISCLETHNATWIKSYWSKDRKRMICEYEAPDAESIRDVQREVGAKFDTAWVADISLAANHEKL